MSRLNITVQEGRQLFNNLQKDLRRICEEELKEFEDPSTSRGAEEFESLWTVVDREFRNVYEMSRFGINVEDLDEDTNNIDIFRGYCEDIDGVEPRDGSLINRISQETQAIQDLLEHNAMYRISIPAKIEEYFGTHVQERRQLFDRLLEPPARTQQPTMQPEQQQQQQLPSETPISELPPPDTLARAMNELSTRLTHSAQLLSTLKESSLTPAS